MKNSSIVDVNELVCDLRLTVNYAAHAGLLRDRNILDVLKAADEVIRGAGQSSPDVHTLMKALSDVAQIIAPMTVADLKYDRDPFSPANQRRSQRWQLGLSLFALIMLLFVGYFMHSLQIEQSAIFALDQIQAIQPQLKLTSLRKMAQYDKPIVRGSPLYDQFHQKVLELRQVNSKLFATYNEATEAASLPLFPLEQYVREMVTATPASVPSSTPLANSGTLPAEMVTPAGSGASDARQSRILSDAAGETLSAPAVGTPRDGGAPHPSKASATSEDQFCIEEAGRIRLPAGSASLPTWIKEVLEDALWDFCFQLKVLSPGGDGALLNQIMSQLGFVSHIRNKIDLRVRWFLPFLFGLLGATLYMMRNVASVRTSAMKLFPIIMRLSLGGVAGIVIGWFTAAATPGTEITRTLSLPFALAFLVGYGIDALFNLLDRLHRSIGEPPKPA